MQGKPDNNADLPDSVHELEEKLYQPGRSYDFNAHRSRLSPRRSILPKSSGIAVGETADNSDAGPRRPWIRRVLIGSIAFFGLALGILVLFFAQGRNSVSADNIEMSVNGPVSIKGGEVLDLQLVVTNNNAVALEYVDLTVEFPEGSRDPRDQTKNLTRVRESIGAIAPGESVSKLIEGVLFGEDNSEKEIIFKLDYRFGDSNIIAVKTKPFKIVVSSSPVSIALAAPSEVTSNQEIELVIDTTSNALAPLKNMLIEVKYPPGFSLKSSTPEPYSGKSVWSLGTLEPGKKKTIKLRGIIEGQEDEQKAFRIFAGSESAAEGVIGVPFGTLSRTVAVRRPALAGSVFLNGAGSKEVAVSSDSDIVGTILVSNNLPVAITNPRIEILLSGTALDRDDVQADEGYFDSRENRLFWDRSTDETFARLDPGASAEYGFDIGTLPIVGSQGVLKNATVELAIKLTGERELPSGGVEQVVTIIPRTVKIATGLDLLPRAAFYSGPFTNTGTLPPKAERETTYTIIWSLVNSSNEVSKAEIRAKLPPYVRFIDKVAPLSENIRFDVQTREVIWQPGIVKAGVGYGSPAREVAFGIAFTPGLGQVDSEPELVGGISLMAHDNFTNTDIASIKRALTTVLTNEPRFRPGDGKVVK